MPCGTLDASAQIYWWTTPAGRCYLGREASAGSGTSTTGLQTWPGLCPADGEPGENIYEHAEWSDTGGWYVGGACSADATGPAYTARQVTVRAVTRSGGGSVNPAWSQSEYDAGYPNKGTLNSAIWCKSPQRYLNGTDTQHTASQGISAAFGGATATYSESIWGLGSGASGAAILWDDTGVVLARAQRWGSMASGSATQGTEDVVESYTFDGTTFPLALSPGTSRDNALVVQQGRDWTQYFSGTYVRPPDVTAVSETPADELAAWLCTSSGDAESLPGEDWDGLTEPIDPVSLPTALVSAGGTAVRTGPGRVLVGPAGLSADVLGGGDVRPLGAL